jgi:hypothetical protein
VWKAGWGLDTTHVSSTLPTPGTPGGAGGWDRARSSLSRAAATGGTKGVHPLPPTPYYL